MKTRETIMAVGLVLAIAAPALGLSGGAAALTSGENTNRFHPDVPVARGTLDLSVSNVRALRGFWSLAVHMT